MAQNLVVRLRDQVYAAWKFCLAARKSDWELIDYPVVIREVKVNPEYIGTRYRQYRYSALIVNWGLVGLGDTKQEALQALESNLATAKSERAESQKPVPRPGARVPIEFASQERISKHPDLARDFIRRVLDVEGAWISDESTLWDFHAKETNDELIAKIKEIYGVDVSDLHSAKLCEILERVAATQESRPELGHD
jgi:hypothetical protein